MKKAPSQESFHSGNHKHGGGRINAAANILLNKLSFNQQKTFRPKISLWNNNSRFSLAGQLADTAVLSVDLRQAVICPPDYDLNEWLAVNMVDFFNQINLIYGNVSEFCTKATCPVMNAGAKYDYHWADGVTFKKPIKCPAPEYVSYLMAWVQSRFDNQDLFPRSADTPFPPNFFDEVRSIFKRLFRVYAHLYYSHFKNVETMGMDAVVYLNTCFKHFMLFVYRYSLIDRKELEPLNAVTNKLLNSDEQAMSPGNFDDSPQMTRSHSKQSSQLTVKGAIMGSSTNTQPLILALKRVMIMPTVVYASSEAAVKELSNLTGIRQVATDAVSVVTRPDIDVVFIAGAIKERKQLFLAAVNADKHAIVEYPASVNRTDLAEMLAASSRRQKELTSQLMFYTVNFPWRYLPTSRRMRSLFLKDSCGDLMVVRGQVSFRIDPTLQNVDAGAPWFQQQVGVDAAYLVDLIQFVTGLRFKNVSAILKRNSLTNEPEVLAVQGVLGDNNVPGSLSIAYSVCAPDILSLELLGAKGSLVLKDLALLSCSGPTPAETTTVGVANPALMDVEEGLPTTHTAVVGGISLMTRALRALVVDDDEQIHRDAANIGDALYVQTVIDALKESIDSGANSSLAVVIPDSTLSRSNSRDDVPSTA